MGIGATLKGNGNLLAIAEGLRKMPDKLIKTDVKAIQKECWEIVQRAAIANAPEDTGRLKKMIIVKVGVKKNGDVFAVVGLRQIKRKEREKIRHIKQFGRTVSKKDGTKELRGPTRKELDALEFDAYYGVFVEFGTEFQKAQPFMRPAFDENFQAVFTLYGEKLRKRIEKRLTDLKSKAQSKSI